MNRKLTLVVATLLAVFLGMSLGSRNVPEALAVTTYQDIASAGPLTHVYIGDELSCQIAHTGDASLELYPPSTIPGDCGTFLVIDAELYAPNFTDHGGTATGGLGTYTPFSPVSQTAVTGTGTAGDPFKVVTVVDAGITGIRVTETDTYVIGDESYRTDIQLQNTTGAEESVIIYRGGDCFLGGSDTGYGLADPVTKSVGCTKTANNVPADRIEVWSPITPVDHYYQAFYSEVWAAIGLKTNLNDTCECTTLQDNGAAIEWDRTLAGGASTSLSHLTTFSPLGSQPLAVTKVAGAPTATAGGPASYTITVSNPNAGDVQLTSLSDTLPAGFSYTPGSSSGLTTTDPSIAAQTLTWTGPFTIPGGSSATQQLSVVAASQAGTYFNNASGVADGFDVVPSGDTAPITVSESTPPTATATPLPTDTPIPTETAVPSATSTNVPPPTDTPVPTETTVPPATPTDIPPTDTPTSTHTPVPTSTHTPVPTSTQTPPSSTTPAVTRTAVVTRTVQATRTVAVTRTAVVTRTVQPTATTAPPAPCMTLGEKLWYLLGALRRLGSREGQWRYDARFDFDDNGRINWLDVEIIFDTPTCRHRTLRWHHHGW